MIKMTIEQRDYLEYMILIQRESNIETYFNNGIKSLIEKILFTWLYNDTEKRQLNEMNERFKDHIKDNPTIKFKYK